MDVSTFDYDLPEAAIAQTPIEPRDAAQLLVDRGAGCEPEHRHVSDLPALLGPGDLVVLNDTSVLDARLRLTKPTGGAVEVLLLEPLAPGVWEALVRPSRRVAPGTVLQGDGLRVTVGGDRGDGRRSVELDGDGGALDAAIARNGEVPLPPYIHAALADPDRYQTVYRGDRSELASVAAPTAGLHLTPGLIAGIEAVGADIAKVRLAVGLGTFRPITADRVEDHRMHEERFSVPEAVMEACAAADRVIAVGTTVVRALESAAVGKGSAGRTDLFISRGYDFRVVDAMITNFHVPRSSLLVMIDAFIGPRWRTLYEEALAERYRFLSFGDAMFLQRSTPT